MSTPVLFGRFGVEAEPGEWHWQLGRLEVDVWVLPTGKAWRWSIAYEAGRVSFDEMSDRLEYPSIIDAVRAAEAALRRLPRDADSAIA